MAAIENLEIVVDVDISKAVAALSELQDELQDIADEINKVDARGTEGIDINTRLKSIDDDLAALSMKIEAWEAANSVDIDTNVEGFRGGAGGGGGGRIAQKTMPGRLQMMEASQADNIGELFDMMNFRGGRRQRDRGLLGTAIDSVSESLGSMTDSIQNFDLRMSDMHNALAKLVPLLLMFIGALPAAITAIFGLAVAAGAAAAGLLALAGLGALGVGLQDGQFDAQRLQDVMMEVRDDFIEAFAPLAERVQPLFEDAIRGLDRFFQAVANEGDALAGLTDEARAFGSFLMGFMPGALRDLGAMVEALAPIFGNIGDFLDDEFTNVMRMLTGLTAEAVPMLATLVLTIGRMIPAIVRMSNGFLFFTAVLLKGISLIGAFLRLIGISPEVFGGLIAFTLLAVSAILLLNSALLKTAFNGLVKLGAVMLGYIGKALGFSAANVIATLSTWGLYQALLALLALTGIGLVLVGLSAAVSTMGENFASSAKDVDSMTSSLKEFDRVSSGTGTGGFNPYGAGTEGAGAADVSAGHAASRGGGSTVINIESSGDRERDKSNARYAKHQFKQGRTSGGNN